ncbi:MAG: SPOR domain-containing protein [Rhodoferax sp.]|nr:SPOR domain-containing protein [Rhodoferax sp.]
MLLRWLALLLLLVNGAYFAWSQGYLQPVGLGPATQSEPQRLAQQIHPQAIQRLSAAEFLAIQEQVKEQFIAQQKEQSSAAAQSTTCWQAGPLDAAQTSTLRQQLADILPAESWQFEEQPQPARWIVYMGKYTNAATLAKKQAQVTAMHIQTEHLENATLQPGFSVGAFASKAQADAELRRLTQKGLRNARVVQEHAPRLAYLLRLPAVDAVLDTKLEAVRQALAAKPLVACLAAKEE